LQTCYLSLNNKTKLTCLHHIFQTIYNYYYCGIRKGNVEAQRYRLTKEEILDCCRNGYALGFRTFVLQGGEDPWYTDERMVEIIRAIKLEYPDCALTLSIGEKSFETYRKFKEAGADRYLLRHETADEVHYGKLHPPQMSISVRKQCLRDLKTLGFQTGAGFMVGSPYQTAENLADDLLFLKELKPEMVGIGPFIPHCDTQFADLPSGSVELTLTMLALTRLMLPKVLLPATTALATLAPKDGRIRAFEVGANVVMPNLSPEENKGYYSLYNNKLSTGIEAAESIERLRVEIEKSGNQLDMSRGDHVDLSNI